MSYRILVVEDDREIADFLTRGLREEGFTVEHAADGTDGWHRLGTGAWDAVLLDWWLPGADGIALLKRYRSAGGVAPVLMLTARDAVPDRVAGLDAARTIISASRSHSRSCWPASEHWSAGRLGRRSRSWRMPTCGWTSPPTGQSGPAAGWT